VTNQVISADGTTIAYEQVGSGPAVVLVAGMLCDRRSLAPLASMLADRATAVTYDRRGRGDSGNTGTYAPEREIEDLRAVAQACGARVLYGHSSGAVVALEAVGAGVVADTLVLHEPPYGADDADSIAAARELAASVSQALDDGRPGDALRSFFGATGMPPEMVEGMATDPSMLALAPTMVHDLEITGERSRGGTIPTELVASIEVPTLVLCGDETLPFFQDTAKAITDLLPDGTLRVLRGQGHDAATEVVAAVLGELLSS
jgi:pimeloyl-ACP methyl ester carboxylesterase